MSVKGGIDLGTTYSSISYYDAYNTRVETIDLNSADGAKILRSVVYYPGAGQPPVVGETAWNVARQYPDRVIRGIKRAMGTAFKTAAIDSVEYTPQQVSAEILKVIVADAQKYLGEEVKEVVITVPAYFADAERAATEEAGKLAGLTVLGLLPEPHAAALAFAIENVAKISDKYLLVYDLGGGTFDITLIHARSISSAGAPINLKIDTVCKDGEMELGGLDWDRLLADLVAEKVKQQFGIDVRQDPKNEMVLLDNCEKAKRHLTRTSSISIVADLAGHQADVSVSEFEDRTRDLLMRTQMRVQNVIDEAEQKHGIKKDQVEVLLAGGSSRMPAVARMLEAMMGKPPMQHKNPELLVTIGAAYWAYLNQAQAPASGSKADSAPAPAVQVNVPGADGKAQKVNVTVPTGGLTDTSTTAIGVAVLRPDGQGGYKECNAVVVAAGARYRDEFQKEFATSAKDMTEIPVVLYEGESEDLAQCKKLMTFTITGLPPGLPKGTKVKVTLQYDDSGILRGSAQAETGQKVDIVFDRRKVSA